MLLWRKNYSIIINTSIQNFGKAGLTNRVPVDEKSIFMRKLFQIKKQIANFALLNPPAKVKPFVFDTPGNGMAVAKN